MSKWIPPMGKYPQEFGIFCKVAGAPWGGLALRPSILSHTAALVEDKGRLNPFLIQHILCSVLPCHPSTATPCPYPIHRCGIKSSKAAASFLSRLVLAVKLSKTVVQTQFLLPSLQGRTTKLSSSICVATGLDIAIASFDHREPIFKASKRSRKNNEMIWQRKQKSLSPAISCRYALKYEIWLFQS